MSVKLFKLFVSTLRQSLQKYPTSDAHLKLRSNSGVQLRYLSTMDPATEKKSDEKEQGIVPNRNMTRFKRRWMKQQWTQLSPKEENGESEVKRDKPTERIKRKKMAILLGYCGVDYYGMQRNPGVRTIEEDLLKALLDAKYITEEDFKNQQNAQFQRSSRTDKGVSAARQVVSMKLPLEVDIEEINKRLPECIKVFGVKRVTNKFNSKIKCNARSYSYTLPTFAFESSVTTEEERRKYRITPEKIEEVKKLLSIYKGTKSYHNFTEKKHHQDPSSLRYMMGFDIEKVFVENGMEFAVLVVKGQSFMLHQIRKMVGLVIAVARGLADKATVERAFSKEKVITPTAPGLGLVLDMVHYDKYDTKFKNSHDSLTWEAEEETVQKFKHDYIYPIIVKGEIEGNSMATWLDEKLSRHSYEPSEEVAGQKETEAEAGGDDDEDDEVFYEEKVGDDKVNSKKIDEPREPMEVLIENEESDNKSGSSNETYGVKVSYDSKEEIKTAQDNIEQDYNKACKSDEQNSSDIVDNKISEDKSDIENSGDKNTTIVVKYV